ncbi:MAG: N-acetylmuramoyl-L-alanine amidase [Oscillospiraceae bacterium]|nr:N-acetylmuramoyl-L-alanine amidase [Oscillospiraceae bacterium]
MIFVLRKKYILAAFIAVGAAVMLLSSIDKGAVPIFSHSNRKIIVLDAGHGDPDGGAVGAGGSVESELNLAVAKKLKKRLEKLEFTVIMTREDEYGIHSDGQHKSIQEKKREDMHKRLDIANNSDADIFMSIHMNMFRDGKYRGAEVLYSEKFENAVLLAELIQAKLIDIDPEKQTRTAKKADNSIFLMKNAEVPAVLVECGFLSNPEEEALLKTPEYQDKIVKAIADGITEYYRSIEGRKDIL